MIYIFDIQNYPGTKGQTMTEPERKLAIQFKEKQR